jgi:hypothetical protein
MWRSAHVYLNDADDEWYWETTDGDLSDLTEMLGSRPVARQFAGHTQSRDRLRSRSHETADRHVMRLRRDAAGCIGEAYNVSAL